MMMILIAGPYRGGTNDDPVLIKKNLDNFEKDSLAIFRAGHIAVVGEWFALPLLRLAGSKKLGDQLYKEISYPIAHRLIEKCDAVYRIPGASNEADQDVAVAKEYGLPVYYNLQEIPGLV
ncbi:MAG: hypothetical protein ACJAXB_002572 [Candidatus Endobugula sp.]|jgi:hypothetical protein